MTNIEKIKLENRLKTITTRHSGLSEMFHDDYFCKNDLLLEVINEMFKEMESIKEILAKKNEYLFNFVGGGWNSVNAYTEEEAIILAKEKYKDSNTLIVDEKTFRVTSKEDYANLLSLFY